MKCEVDSSSESSDTILKAYFDTYGHENNDNQEIVTANIVKCELCNRELPSSSLKSHILSVHCGKGRVYICAICDTELGTNTSLKNHIRSIHIGNNTKYCTECCQNVSKLNFRRHVLEQHRQVKYKCKYCDKLFTMSNLGRHIKSVHNNLRQICQHCGKSYRNLEKHIKNVHMELNTICDICDEEIPWSMKYTHIYKFHPNVEKSKKQAEKLKSRSSER